MDWNWCPYDGSIIEATALAEGSAVLTCATCGGQWEMHESTVVRVIEPDWDAVRAYRDARSEGHG